MWFQSSKMKWRSLFGRAERKRPATARRVQPTLQGLEDRDLKSTASIVPQLFPPGPCVIIINDIQPCI